MGLASTSCTYRALRYSEDLDYVRATKGPIGPTLNALRDVAGALSMEVRTDVREFPKVFLRGAFESGSGRMQIKIEINTYEVSPAIPHVRLPLGARKARVLMAASTSSNESSEIETFTPA